MKNILGKTDLTTDFDQEIDWITFPKEFFAPDMIEAALQRLVFWGGLAAILLLKTDSQITGLSAFLYDLFPTDYQQETPASPATPAADPAKPLDKKPATTKPAVKPAAKLPGKPGRPAAA
jgi:hypothetical protein